MSNSIIYNSIIEIRKKNDVFDIFNEECLLN